MAVQQKRVGVAEFEALPDDGDLHELVRGEARVMPPPKGRHGQIEATVVAAVNRYLDDRARAPGWEPRQGLAARERLVGFAAAGEFGMRLTLPDGPIRTTGGPIGVVGWGESLRDDALLPGFELPLNLVFVAPADTAGADTAG